MRRSSRSRISRRRPASSPKPRCARFSANTSSTPCWPNAQINDNIQSILDEHYHSWGISVLTVEIKNVDLNESMIRAIARQAEAERNRRAKVIDAEGELQAADRLRQAGEILAVWPQAMQLRSLLTLQSIAGDKSSTIVFPLPIDLASALGVGRAQDSHAE